MPASRAFAKMPASLSRAAWRDAMQMQRCPAQKPCGKFLTLCAKRPNIHRMIANAIYDVAANLRRFAAARVK
jgi:hypothetical protein